MDITQNGKKIPVVVAVSKPGLMFFLDRETGKSVYPDEERPCRKAMFRAKRRGPHSRFP